jgi:hypothetical protein
MVDDWCGVLENGPLLCHFTTQEEEFFEIGTVSLKRLVTLLRQCVEGRFNDVFFVEVGPVGVRVSTLHT